MKEFKHYTLSAYLDVLSKKTPVPGGGSAAAFVAATGAALISMAAEYSMNKGKPKGIGQKIFSIRKQSERIRKRLLELVDLDAQGYMKVVNAKGAAASVRQKAMREAAKAPREVCRLCYQAMQLMPYLVENGNPYLISDIKVAAEILYAGFNAAHINGEINT